MLRVVIDTNVLISAFVGHGKPRKLVLELLGRHQVVTSPQMLAELIDVLSRAKPKQDRSRPGHFCRFLQETRSW